MIRNNIKILRDYKIYPDQPGYVVEIKRDDGSSYEAIVPKAELDLSLYLKTIGLDNSKLLKLDKLIEDYGSEKYNEASNDAAMDAAGADL